MKSKKHPTQRVGRNPRIHTPPHSSNTPEKASEETTERKPKGSKTEFLMKAKQAPRAAVMWFKGLHRNAKLALILGAVLLLVGTVALASSGTNRIQEFAQEVTGEIEESEPVTAKILDEEGTLQAQDEEGEWQDISTEYELTLGSILRTVGATSRAVIGFEDGSELRLDANSQIELLTANEARIVVKHTAGYTYSRVIDNPDRAYIVESTDAQYEALGTAFKTAASGDEQSVEVYHSKVQETKSNETPEQGEKLTVKSRISPSSDGTIKRLDIEEVKQDKFITWNRERDEASELWKNQLGFLRDIEAPQITVTSPADNETILLDASAEEGSVQISGTTEKNAVLTVQAKSVAGSVPVEVVVDENGNFKTPILTSPLGSSVFTFVVKDRTGNTAEYSVRYTFQRKSAPVSTNNGINLSGEISDGKVKLSWNASSTSTPEGVKIVYDKSANPTHPDDNPEYVEKGNTWTKKTELFDSGSIYYFRVCAFDKDDNSCSNYSNQVKLEIT